MAKQVRIQIRSDNFDIEVTTESEITQHLIKRIEKNIHTILNRDIAHDMRGRITSINMSLAMLERYVPVEGEQRLQMLKLQVEDLSRMLEVM